MTLYWLFAPFLAALAFGGCREESRVVQRPEKVVSLREVIYDNETYTRLDSLWSRYHEAYPSEDAYANWMYAARYAGDPEYPSLLEAGVRRYPSNPRLLYLRSMVHHGRPNDLEALTLLERAVELDPSYTDPWFSLVIHYFERGEREKANFALRKLLEAGAIQEEVMDFSYNMLAGLEPNAVIVTNGDNDTYPVWILTRVARFREDVRLVNMSLLNTDWYALTLPAEGLPSLISAEGMDSLKSEYVRRLTAARTDPSRQPGPFSDELVRRLVRACTEAGRPMYFAATCQPSESLRGLKAGGRELGLATLVSPQGKSEADQVRRITDVWLKEFRTAGIDSWRMRYAPGSNAGKILVQNYGTAMQSQMDRFARHAPDQRLPLFRWYRDHLRPVLAGRERESLDRTWCRTSEIGEIKEWCRKTILLN